LPIGLPPAHSFSNLLCNLLLLRRADVVQIHAVSEQLLKHVPHKILVHIICAEVGSTEQRPKTGLVLNGSAGRHNSPSWRIVAACCCRPSVIATSPRLSTAFTASLVPPPFSWWLKTIAAAAWYADLSQAEPLHIFKNSTFILIFRSTPSPQSGQHIVARSVLLLVSPLLFVVLSSPRVRL
jgi:hypothetical protein